MKAALGLLGAANLASASYFHLPQGTHNNDHPENEAKQRPHHPVAEDLYGDHHTTTTCSTTTHRYWDPEYGHTTTTTTTTPGYEHPPDYGHTTTTTSDWYHEPTPDSYHTTTITTHGGYHEPPPEYHTTTSSHGGYYPPPDDYHTTTTTSSHGGYYPPPDDYHTTTTSSWYHEPSPDPGYHTTTTTTSCSTTTNPYEWWEHTTSRGYGHTTATSPKHYTTTTPKHDSYTTPHTNPPHYTPAPGSFKNACGILSKSYSSAKAAYPTARAVAVHPRDAWDCLYSVPLDKEVTLEFIKEVKKYFEFQSTIHYLKNPPESSLQDPIDLIGGLNHLAELIGTGEIAHHAIFEKSFSQLVQRVHDGHFSWFWSSSQLVVFTGPFTIVSLSKDGIEEPKVYPEDDVYAEGIEHAAWITKIDGYDVEDWLTEWADFSGSQSPDARYNSLFANKDPGSSGRFYNLYGWYPGKNTIKITYSNKTELEYPYQAYATWNSVVDWTGINDGEDFYYKAVLDNTYFSSEHTKLKPKKAKRSSHETSTSAHPEPTISSDTSNTRTPKLVYYNQPYMTHKVGPYVQDLNGIIGGYFLNDTLNTAVLDISSFAAEDSDATYQLEGFQAALYEFFAECKEKKSKKLIIDVRGNGGGLVWLGYELYKQLFPSAPAKSWSRFRSHEAAQIIGEWADLVAPDDIVKEWVEEINNLGWENVNDIRFEKAAAALRSGYSRQNVLDTKGNKPKNAEVYIGPYQKGGDNVSEVVEYNLNFLLGDHPVSGFGDLKNFTSTPQPFKKEDILLLSDGTCASTCTIFAEMIKSEQDGVASLVIGGRPNDASSAHVGGTHGSTVLTFTNLHQTSLNLMQAYPPETQEDKEYYWKYLPLGLPFLYTYAAINFRDAIRLTDKTETPLQFALEPADCRLYFTPKTFFDSITLWDELSKLAWGTGSIYKKCAVGGLKPGEESTEPIPDDDDSDVINWILHGVGLD